MSDKKVLVEAKDHILTITFNRPEKYNALDPESYHILAQALYRLQHEKNLRVGIIQSHGDHFTSGLELDKWAPIFANGGEVELAADELDPYGIQGERLTKPLICAVQGLCYTSGLELLLNTDIRIATKETRFAQLEVKRGIYPCGGGTIRLPQEIGWANAQRYILTGDEFNAEQAFNWGLVQEIVARDELHNRARELATKIAKAAPLGVQAALKSSKLSRYRDHETALSTVFEDMPKIIKSKDAQEGVRSFLERREAKFVGE
ncbi:crotonase/enoyl-CoA hydratase family protein [Bermanella marisrubri]|uniref:Enoyl-CoA hydratase n=1 Tax=Bermanella marisrubri TaxID=207949 RepID=Q1N1G1_9GAMM|nr:crotonase/enoyl-CoA hydratase family protein [Bermanella marisrubri]EAT12089.1 enoyl-CoA hydratase [Oceanobacter sp. RED65] [Bermanella marisrubri]QIZ83554.1 crotonase/enoyl-CoA hydratase family protein [Bermanella marisrubri]